MNAAKFLSLLLPGVLVCAVPSVALADVADIDVDSDTDSGGDSDAQAVSEKDTDGDSAVQSESSKEGEDSDDGSDAGDGEEYDDGDGGGKKSCSFAAGSSSDSLQFIAVVAMILAGLRLRRRSAK